MKSRIERIQDCHPWLLEAEVRHILVSLYSALHHLGRGKEFDIDKQMEDATELVCNDDRESIEGYLKSSGGLFS